MKAECPILWSQHPILGQYCPAVNDFMLDVCKKKICSRLFPQDMLNNLGSSELDEDDLMLDLDLSDDQRHRHGNYFTQASFYLFMYLFICVLFDKDLTLCPRLCCWWSLVKSLRYSQPSCFLSPPRPRPRCRHLPPCPSLSFLPFDKRLTRFKNSCILSLDGSCHILSLARPRFWIY